MDNGEEDSADDAEVEEAGDDEKDFVVENWGYSHLSQVWLGTHYLYVYWK